ncbi:MAG: HD domain-containing protein [Ruminococcus sp.]|nr:HD domain-containing protein [Ruminococcus sp.]
MIDIQKARIAFKDFLNRYEDKDTLGFNLKVVHTYHVVDNARTIATKLNLSEDDVYLAELIALLHDIGRFEEITFLKQFDSVKFDHASYGVKMLFEDNLIRNFIKDESYDEIIKIAIDNHSRLTIQDGLDERALLHSKIIRDADKLDNFRVKKEEKIEAIFPGKVRNMRDMEDSKLSYKVYNTVKEKKCVDIHDRVTLLDYWVCVLAFIFDLNFKESYEIVKNHNYINILIDRFNYNDLETRSKMEDIRLIMNSFIDCKTK